MSLGKVQYLTVAIKLLPCYPTLKMAACLSWKYQTFLRCRRWNLQRLKTEDFKINLMIKAENVDAYSSTVSHEDEKSCKRVVQPD